MKIVILPIWCIRIAHGPVEVVTAGIISMQVFSTSTMKTVMRTETTRSGWSYELQKKKLYFVESIQKNNEKE